MSKLLQAILFVAVLHRSWASCFEFPGSRSSANDRSSRGGNITNTESATIGDLDENREWSRLTQWPSKPTWWNQTVYLPRNQTNSTMCQHPHETTQMAGATDTTTYATTITQVTIDELDCTCSRRSAPVSTGQPLGSSMNWSSTSEGFIAPIVTPVNLSSSWTVPPLTSVSTYLSTASREGKAAPVVTLWWTIGGMILVSTMCGLMEFHGKFISRRRI